MIRKNIFIAFLFAIFATCEAFAECNDEDTCYDSISSGYCCCYDGRDEYVSPCPSDCPNAESDGAGSGMVECTNGQSTSGSDSKGNYTRRYGGYFPGSVTYQQCWDSYPRNGRPDGASCSCKY